MNESVAVKKDIDLARRKEYVDSFFSLIPDATAYMTSQNIQLAIESLNKALERVRKEEEEERWRIERENADREAKKKIEALKKAEAKRRKEEERKEEIHVKKVTCMDLPDDWTNCFSSDEVVSTTSIYEALDNSLETLGEVNIEYIAACVEKDVTEVISSLSDQIMQNPEKWDECFYKGWELKKDYFTGCLSQKLRVAKEANRKYKGYFRRNVEELERIVPSFGTKDIYITLGSPWVPCEIIDEFIFSVIFRDYDLDEDLKSSLWTAHEEITGRWKINGRQSPRSSGCGGKYRGPLFETYGTSRMDALALLENILNMSTLKIMDKMEDPSGRKREISIFNKNETLKILEKQEKMVKEFKDWVWQDERRMNILISRYTERNSFGFCIKKEYDGSRLKFPRLNPNVSLYAHQRNAVKRIISTPNTLLAHDVGTGKTYTMIVAGMMLRHIQPGTKNLYVVPNSILSQWKSAFSYLYPDADVMVVDNSVFNVHKREETLSRIKNEDHDAILMTYSSFDLIPLSLKWYEEDLKRKIQELKASEEKNKVKMTRKINTL
ncbi:MAG: DEAD/DEAH box helicase family protein, partial [Candidatus Ornithospirochaeta sp.]